MKRFRKFVVDTVAQHFANQQAILAASCEIVSELRHQSAVLENLAAEHTALTGQLVCASKAHLATLGVTLQ
jgi:hypothetical protein